MMMMMTGQKYNKPGFKREGVCFCRGKFHTSSKTMVHETDLLPPIQKSCVSLYHLVKHGFPSGTTPQKGSASVPQGKRNSQVGVALPSVQKTFQLLQCPMMDSEGKAEEAEVI